MNSYLEFDFVLSPSGKTLQGTIRRKHGGVLGQILWYGAWRQYAFFPLPGTIWNPDYLDEVNAQIRRLMQERFEKRKK